MTPSTHHRKAIFILLIGLLGLYLAGCAGISGPTTGPAPAQPSPSFTPTFTPAPPTPTPEPLAVLVNGEPVTLADFQAEVDRFTAAGTASSQAPAPEEARKRVLEDVINRVLLAEAAAEGGYTVDEPALQARIDQLSDQIGGPQALKDWQAAHGYSEEGFRRALRLDLGAAWQRDQVTGQVPTAAEQVHARQILVPSEEAAQKVLDRLQPGMKFATLAFKYDPVSGGDLGWFPQGYLELQEVESAAFALQPEQYSGIIQSTVGYHVIEVIERDPQRPLNSDQRLALQKKALQAWLDARRASSQIERLIQ